MTHEELCERARRWLSGTRRCEPVFSNIASCSEIPDAIGWSSSYGWRGSTVIECKTSRSDFYADKNKYLIWIDPKNPVWRFPIDRVTKASAGERGWEISESPRMGDFRFFMCEQNSGITAELVEKQASDHGLLFVKGRQVIVERPAMRRASPMIDKDAEIRYLRFAIINNKQPQNYVLDFSSEVE